MAEEVKDPAAAAVTDMVEVEDMAKVAMGMAVVVTAKAVTDTVTNTDTGVWPTEENRV